MDRECLKHGRYMGTDCPRCAGEGKVLLRSMRSAVLHAVIESHIRGNGSWLDTMEAAVLLLEEENHCLKERLVRALAFVPDAGQVINPNKPAEE